MTNFRPGRYSEFPDVVKNLIIINVLMVLLQMVLIRNGINLDTYLALHYWSSPLFRWWQPFTHMFMHGDPRDLQGTIMHIFFNMYALWMFGKILENLWGPKRFLLFYLVCGLGAALCHMGVLTYQYSSFHNDMMNYQAHPGFVEYAQFIRHHSLDKVSPFGQVLNMWSGDNNCIDCIAVSKRLFNEYYMIMINEPTVGASGAVFGLLFAFGYLFPNTELFIMFIPVPIKAKWFVAIYAIIELSQGVYNSAGDNIAHFAHLGGMLFAFILLRMWSKKIRNDFY